MDVLANILGSIWWMVVAIGVLVTFHEYGHFVVARRSGVKVLRFSVGFGRPLWSRRGPDDTEYVIAAIPLGGYVKMLDEREGEVPRAERHRAFNRKGVWTRIAIVAAGPAFNLIFTVAAFWMMFMIGVTDVRPMVGEVSGVAEQAGLQTGDEIVAVEGRETGSWTGVVVALVGRALDRVPVSLTVAPEEGDRRELTLPLDRLESRPDENRLLESIGIQPWRPALDPVVGEVSAGGPAEDAGLRPGDHIVAVDGEALESWQQLQEAVRAGGDAGRALRLTLERNGDKRTVEVLPELREADGETRYLIGITAAPPSEAELERYFTSRRHGPVAAAGEALRETGRMTSATLGLLGRMVTGAASTQGLSGPISIAQYANDAAQLGLSRFLYFLAILSLSLAILNLLPIPILDGGHLLYYLIELLKGSPVSEQTQIVGQYVGLAMLAALMGLAFYNDILRLFSA